MNDRSTIDVQSNGRASLSDETSTSRVIWVFIFFHFFVWTLLPVIFHPNAPLDVVEEVAWGREWQWGYYKHPPLASWLANAAYIVSGGRLWSIFLLSQLCIAGCFWEVWKLAREFVNKTRALAAVVLLEGIIYYNFTSPEFNPNVLQLPLWAAISYFTWKAIREDRIPDWILLGVFSGLAMLTKYYSALLLVCVGIAILVCSDRTSRFWKLLLSAAIAFCIFLPHLLWMKANNFPTLTYAVDRASAKKTLLTHLTYPLNFTAAQLLSILLMLIAFFVLYRKVQLRNIRWSETKARFLLIVGLCPFALTFLIALVMNWKLRSMWGASLWNLLPLILLIAAPKMRANEQSSIRTSAIVLVAVMALGFVLPLTLGPYLYSKPRKALFGGETMARQITDTWRAATGRPLEVSVGDTWLAGNLAFYSKDRPAIFTDANPRFSPWITQESIRKSGAVIVWQDSSVLPELYRSKFPDAQIQAPVTTPWHTKKRLEPATVYWAIVPPQN